MEDPTRVDVTTESFSVIAPYPWASLERVSRAELAARRGVRHWLAQGVPLEAWAAAAQKIIGVPISVQLDAVTSAVPFEVDGAFAVHLGRAGPSVALGEEVRVEVEPSLAAALLGRTMGRRAPSAVTHGFNAPKAVAGAFAALLVATARRAAHPRALVIRRAGLAAQLGQTSVNAASEAAGDCATWLAVSFTVFVAGEAFAARLLVHHDVPGARDPAWRAGELAALGPTPLTIPIVACIASVPRADLAALSPGDVFLPLSWAMTGPPGEALRGRVTLAAPLAAMGVRAHFGDGGALVLSGEIDALSAAEADMGDAEETAAILSAVGDVPVVVRVEIGEARMSAREWASLRPGDVVTLGRKVGQQVVLRVGGVPVARGQLVEVEGEVGVRIEERVVEERTTA